jgi:hypothetical protein
MTTKASTVYSRRSTDMTQSVADKTPISVKPWRRHSDPPGLWIAVVTASISLHLLAFWLMLTSNTFSLLLQTRSSQAAVPIEIVEISAQRRSKLKPRNKAKPRTTVRVIASKRSPKKQISVLTRNQQQVNQRNITAKPAPSISDKNAIAFTNNTNKKIAVVKPVIKPVIKPAVKPKPSVVTQQRPKAPVVNPTITPTVNPTITPTVNPTVPAKVTPPTPRVTPKPQPTREPNFPEENLNPQPTREPNFPDNTNTNTFPGDNSSLRDEKIDENQSPDISSNPTDSFPGENQPPQRPRNEGEPLPAPEIETGEAPSTDIAKTSPTLPGTIPDSPTKKPPTTPPTTDTGSQTGGGLFASLDILPPEAQKGYGNVPRESVILPKYLGDAEKQVKSLFISQNLDQSRVEFRVNLVIDQNGKFVQAVVDKNSQISEEKRSNFQEFATEVFKDEKFQPASTTDGSKPPELSNLIVRIVIERR